MQSHPESSPEKSCQQCRQSSTSCEGSSSHTPPPCRRGQSRSKCCFLALSIRCGKLHDRKKASRYAKEWDNNSSWVKRPFISPFPLTPTDDRRLSYSVTLPCRALMHSRLSDMARSLILKLPLCAITAAVLPAALAEHEAVKPGELGSRIPFLCLKLLPSTLLQRSGYGML